MGFMDTVKGWFNIGGVKVKLAGINPQVSRAANQLTGKVMLTSKGEKHVLKLTYKLVEERTTGSGDKKETKETVFGEWVARDEFDMKTGETKTLDFTLPYSIPERLADKKGMLGAVGKIGSFAQSEKLEYQVIAECDVKGTAFDPSDKVRVNIVA